MKVILWGTGRVASNMENFINYEDVIIMAYVDNNEKMWGKERQIRKNKKEEVPVIGPVQLCKYLKRDMLIIIASSYVNEIKAQLKSMNIPDDQIVDRNHERFKDIVNSNYFDTTSYYEIDGFQLKLASDSMMTFYRRENAMYNSFVPYLALIEQSMADSRYKDCEHWIVDIGANIGDTTLGMIKKTTASIVAVEPDLEYFSILKENIRNIDHIYSDRVKIIQAFISNDENEKFVTVKNKGTAFKSKSEVADVPTLSIPSLLRILEVDFDKVNLIKTDTDGFDADCIISCGKMLRNSKAILYWENQIEDSIQYSKYMKLYEYLNNCNYLYYFVFDNFGNYIGCVDNDTLKNINKYLMRINSYWSERTFFYVDILACKEKQKEIVETIIELYIDNYPVNRYKEQV